jgi:low temperature requirement protein LtrA
MNEPDVESVQRVTPLELFFDLVFVFAITQVTGFLADNPTIGGLFQGLLLLAALWWAWAAYAWLTNTLNPEEGAVRLAVFAVIGAMLIVALATPEAFGTEGVVFGIAYFAVRALHLVLFALAGKGDPELMRAVLRITPTAIAGPLLLVVAGFLDGSAQIALWVAALALDYLGALVGRARGWRVSPEHFVERHGLVVIIALGESVVAIGIGAAGQPLDAGTIVAALLGITVIATLWWAYFDWVAFMVLARLEESTGVERAALARDLYSYLHLPLVAGIVLFAFGLKTTIAHVDSPLPVIPAVGLCGGLALYFLAHVLTRLRIGGGLGRGRPVATLVLIGLIPVATLVPALVALALVAAVCIALIAYEALRYRYARRWIRTRRGHFTLDEARELGRTGGGAPTADEETGAAVVGESAQPGVGRDGEELREVVRQDQLIEE